MYTADINYYTYISNIEPIIILNIKCDIKNSQNQVERLKI